VSSRPLSRPRKVITNGDMSQSTIISEVTVASNLSLISYDISWAGSSPVGVIAIQVSNTYSQNADGSQRDAGNWTTVPLANANISGASGNGILEYQLAGTYAVRLLYTKTSGSGLLQATVNGKVT